MRPNIFDIATKELSQDAFITWLLKWANDDLKNVDSDLNECGKEFVRQLIKSKYSSFNEEINTVTAGRQWENIDVWAKINDKYLIIIEDKTNTLSHSNQLKRYKDDATRWCEKEKYEPPICIYLKIGNESNRSLKSVKNEEYSIFNRVDFLDLLTKFKEKITNNIFVDFCERLEKLERKNHEYKNNPIKDWKPRSNEWQGFFQYLEKEELIVDWNYVNNVSGGFWNATLTNWKKWGEIIFYVQLEEDKVCFKIEVKKSDNANPSSVRNRMSQKVISLSKEKELKLKKPKRFGKGTYMTIAIIESKDWLGEIEQTVDLNHIENKLTEIKTFFDSIIQEQPLF